MERENKPLTSIRGFAALWVVGLHIVSPGPTGHDYALFYAYTAVDLFFILSGFILTRVHGDLTLQGVPGFWLRRVCRLYPLHIFCLLVVVALSSYPIIFEAMAANWKGLLLSASLVFPFLPFEVPANPPSWSIGVEMVCYITFPALIVGLRRVRGRLAFAGLVVLLLAIEYAVQCRFNFEIRSVGAMMRGAAGFTLGMALCRLTDGLDIRRAVLNLGELASVAGIGGAIALRQPEAIPLFGAALLFCLSFDKGLVARVLHARFFLWLGHISFSIYLTHFIVLIVALKWLPVAVIHLPKAQARTLWVICIFAALLALSSLTYRFIEVPGRRLPRYLESLWARRRSPMPVATTPAIPAGALPAE